MTLIRKTGFKGDQRGCSRTETVLQWQSGVALLLLLTLNLSAQTTPSAQQLFDNSHTRADLTALGPYKLTADLLVTPFDKKGRPDPMKQQTGKLTIFRDHDHALIEARVGAESGTQIQVGAIRYIDLKSGLLAALNLENFDRSWDPELAGRALVHPKYTLGKPEKKDSLNELCVAVSAGGGDDIFCFDSESSALLSTRRFQFFDYQPFADDQKINSVQFPRRVIITRPGMPPLEVAHIEVTPGRLPADVLGVSGTVLPIESCEDWKPAKAAYTPEPDFTETARKHKYEATVYINLVVSSDGKVLRARALNDTRYGLDTAAASKVMTWTLSPATCGNRAVNSEMDVQVAFKLF
jgi:Gram-negative bacterial TonB protein C-terminal